MKKELLLEAEKAPFQEIADSPTVKYYTNWRVFQERLGVGDASVFQDLPGWTARIEARKIILRSGVETDYPCVEELPEDHDVLSDLGVRGKMELYHAARLTRAIRITLPSHADAGRILVASLGGDGYVGHHVVVDAQEDSEAEIIVLDLAPGEGDPLKITTLVVNAARGSRVRVVSYTNYGAAAGYSRRIYRLARDASLTLRSLYVSGASTRLHEDAYLNGSSSSIEVYASAVSPRNRWGDYLLNARHVGTRSSSLVTGRGVVLSGGLLSLRGLAMIERRAEWSRSHVEVHVANVEEGAKGYASPMLEIHTGNVEEAFHSASVASLSEETLFYLTSRGLSEDEAKSLLIDGIVAYSSVSDRLGVPLEEILGQ